MRTTRTRKLTAGRVKATGAHYTPEALASFVARLLVHDVSLEPTERLRILDPSCGDGVLLESLLEALHSSAVGRPVEVVGVETDAFAIANAESRLKRFRNASATFVHGDFLELVDRLDEEVSLWAVQANDTILSQPFDFLIANPPYVRTQVLGASKAQDLARRYGLTGRVDLYQAFLVALTRVVRPGGHVGIIMSNRFLTTLGGASVRKLLTGHYSLRHVVDLGDTRLFEAAVLPAIIIARRLPNAKLRKEEGARFLKIYSQQELAPQNGADARPAQDVFEVLATATPGTYRLPCGLFRLSAGNFSPAEGSGKVWSLTTREEASWLDRVRAATCGTFGDVAHVRVGVKTTADEVFIRPDWDTLPAHLHPEPRLLRPLLTHREARRWSLPKTLQPRATILYTHQTIDQQRRVINLDDYPKAKAYLESHRERLERRDYVLRAGREWYEIWVPQDPAAWSQPKIVFPDISPGPRFYVDLAGHIVGGDSYWITLQRHVHQNTLFLLLALANSSLMARYHDLVFNNRLYSGRRRYITQYVAKYPLPRLEQPVVDEIARLVKLIIRRSERSTLPGADADCATVDRLVYEAFRVDTIEGE